MNRRRGRGEGSWEREGGGREESQTLEFTEKGVGGRDKERTGRES